MQFDTTLPLDTMLVSQVAEELRAVKEELGTVCNQVAVPATAISAGEPGNYAVNSTHFYIYTGDGSTHSWVRAAVATF